MNSVLVMDLPARKNGTADTNTIMTTIMVRAAVKNAVIMKATLEKGITTMTAAVASPVKTAYSDLGRTTVNMYSV